MTARQELLTTAEAADYLDLSPSTLAHWRRTGCGPRFYKFSSRAFRYDLDELVEWRASAHNSPVRPRS